jgi:hypothetical protein
MKNARMKSIRPFSKDDIPQVVDMFQRLLLRNNEGGRLQSRDLLPDYFEQIFFHNPWYDEEIASLVYEDAGGKIVGFLGVTPRPMLMQRHPIRMAISLHYMVEPESRTSLAGIHLLKAFFAGPQDLSLTDGAGKVGRKVWEGVGGMTTYLYSQRWARILKPSQFVVSQLAKRIPFATLASVLTPLCRLLDAGTTRLVPKYFPKLNSKHSEEELDTRTLLTYLPQLAGNRTIQPVYDDYSLQWVLNHARQMHLYGTLQRVLVRDQSGEVMGWYLYYLKSDDTSTVIQIVARKNSFNEILDHLFEHARRHGATALIGRLEAQYIQELSDKYCWFDRFSGWTLIHSKNSELLHAIQRGDAFLSRLEGEWCLQF